MAIWFDRGIRFLSGTLRLTTLALPLRVAFWCASDFVSYPLISFQGEGISSRDRHFKIGIDGSQQFYARRYFQTAGGAQESNNFSTATLVLNQWHHVCAEFLTTTLCKLTIDGTNTTTATTLVLSAISNRVVIGGATDILIGTPYYKDLLQPNVAGDFLRYPRAYISDVAFWRGVDPLGLSAAELAQLASMGVPHNLFDPENLNVYMPMRGGTADLVNLDTVAGGGTAFWNNTPALLTRYYGLVEATKTGDFSDGDTFTGGGNTYTFKTALTPADWEVLLGGGTQTSMQNLAAAIENEGTPGTDYSTTGAYAKNTVIMARHENTGDQQDARMVVEEIDPATEVTGTASGTPVKDNGTSTVTATAAVFDAGMVGDTIAFDSAPGGSYVIASFTSTTVIVVTGDASVETGTPRTFTVHAVGPAISVFGAAPDPWIGMFDFDGNSTGGVLVAPPEAFAPKRPAWAWHNHSATDTGEGADNHGHDAPIALGMPVTVW